MKCKAYFAAGAVAASLVLTCCTQSAHAQTAPGPLPQHPIDTRSEGNGTGCSYSGSVTDGKPTSSQTCPPASPAANPATAFPYPGDPAPTTPPPPSLPATTSGTSAPQPAAGGAFPYPGDPEAGTEAGSSSSSSSSSSTAPGTAPGSGGLNDAGSTGEPPVPLASRRRRLNRVDPQSPEEREQEDVEVAGYYQNDGNFTAAYDRAKDAVSLDSTDAAAFVALGDAARRLGKLDEAEKAYVRSLTLDPVPKQKKAAEKALAEMRGGH